MNERLNSILAELDKRAKLASYRLNIKFERAKQRMSQREVDMRRKNNLLDGYDVRTVYDPSTRMKYEELVPKAKNNVKGSTNKTTSEDNPYVGLFYL